MIGETILNIYAPKLEDDWFFLETNTGIYSLRLGGVKYETEIEKMLYNSFYISAIGKIISNVYTDDFVVLIETEEGDGIEHTPNGGITGDGEPYFAVFYLSKVELTERLLAYRQADILLKKLHDFCSSS